MDVAEGRETTRPLSALARQNRAFDFGRRLAEAEWRVPDRRGPKLTFIVDKRLAAVDPGCVKTRPKLQMIARSEILGDFLDSARSQASKKRTKEVRAKTCGSFHTASTHC
jgi:hypothetical protein